MKNLVWEEKKFSKCFLEVELKWKNPPNSVLSENPVTRKRLRSHDSSMEGHPEEDGVRVDVSAGIFPEREADGQPAALSKESAPAPMKENAMPAAHDDLIQEDSFISGIV